MRLAPPGTGAVLTLVTLVAGGSVGCSVVAPQVDRVADGTTERGRYVNHLSYAFYAEAAQLEAMGQFEAAEEAYRRAMTYDPDSWEIWIRLGAVRCAMKKADAKDAFSRAETMAPNSASLWLAEARCETSLGNHAEAVKFAKRSLELDPNHPETTLVISEALRAQGNEDEAHRWLVALAARHPESHAAELWLHGRAGDPSSEGPALAWVDAALLDEQPDLASARALRIGLSEAELAAREVALGQTRQGFERAQAVFKADPSDAAAWVVMAAAADLLGQQEQYQRVVARVDADLGSLDPLSTLLFADLIKRKVSPSAARAWLSEAEASPAGGSEPAQLEDPLASALRTRLDEELAAPNGP